MESLRKTRKQKLITVLKYLILIAILIFISLLITASIIDDILNKPFNQVLREELGYIFSSCSFWLIFAIGIVYTYLLAIYLPNARKRRKERKKIQDIF